uniref:DUF4524 domain-containing protein n=1 Tax=Capra hircus TaxID=9925 RepID=A0A452FNN5_CAPHI
MVMAAEVQMVLYEDASVQVQYIDGSRLRLSPCGSEFYLKRHLLFQTHFVISAYREQLQRALNFRNSFATCPFLSESIIPSEMKTHILIDVSEVRWPGLDTDDGMTCMQSGTVRISSLDGHAYLCLPKSQHEFTVHFLCKVSQQPDSSIEVSEKKKIKRLKNKENELYHQIMKSKEHSEKSCVNGAKRREVLSSPRTKDTCVYTWVKQCWSVASCPEEWKYPLAVCLELMQLSPRREFSVLPRAPLLSCPAPHLHRWNFSDSFSQKQFGAEEYSYHELVKVVWYKAVTYRLTHKHMNSIEIYPGDGSVFKSEGAYLGNYFTYYSIREESEEREEKTYSVNNLPPDRPGSPFSVCSLIKQATRILQHCAKMRLSLSPNYHICCPGINDSSALPLLLREPSVPCVGRFLAYSDDKVHAIFLDGITLTLNWNFGSFIEKRQVNQGLTLGWCKLTFPDGQNQLIQTQHPRPYERYVTTVISWCRRLTQISQQEIPIHPSSSVPEESWSVASELEKIQKFNCIL